MFFRMFKPLLACSVLCLASHVAMAQAKVAVISLQQALFNTAEIKKADAEMQVTFKPRQAKADQLSKEIQDIAQKLQTDAGKMTPQAEFDLNAKYKQDQVDLQRLQEDLQADAQSMRQDVLTKSTEKMQAVVKKLAEEKGLDLVVDTQVTLYVKPAMDLTGEATAAYDKAYPETAAPAAPPAKK